MTKHLILTFQTAGKKDYRLSINNPKDDISKENITAIGEKIVASKIFNSSKHELISFKQAKYVSRTETIIN